VSTIKDKVVELIHHLPEDSTLEEIQYHLYVLEKISNGRQSIKDGNSISNEEAKARLSKWITN
jgi:hypothetical protein